VTENGSQCRKFLSWPLNYYELEEFHTQHIDAAERIKIAA